MTGVGWLLVWIACLAKIYSCVGDGGGSQFAD